MSDQILRAELDRVAGRYRALARGMTLLLLWAVLALVGWATWRWLRGEDYSGIAVATGAAAGGGMILAIGLFLWARQAQNNLWLARRIEQRYPDLDTRLLAALEQHPEKAAGLGFLQQMVIDQAVTHARQMQWTEIISTGTLRTLRLATAGMMVVAALLGVAVGEEWANQGSRPHPLPPQVQKDSPFTIKVEPENTTVERGTALLVMARFNSARLPGEVSLLYRDGNSGAPEQQLAMSKSLDDPLFAARIASVKRDGSYAVRYGDAQTPWYTISVFDYPALKQADAKLKYPDYTGLEEKVVQDTRSVSGVEGTHVTLLFHLNKPVAEARLVPTERRNADAPPLAAGRAGPAASAPAAPAQPLALKADPADPTTYTLTLDLKQSQTYALQLVDADQRSNRDRPQMALNVTINRPPELKVLSPNRDLDVSALEEISVKAQVWDDYGVKRVGVTYAMVGQPPQDVILAENIPGKEHRDISQIISLEKLGAAPDQMLSYHLWVEDIGPDGKTRRTEGAMFFADVRPFEEIYRQGEELAQGQQDPQQRQQQQQQQQGQQGNQNAQRADEVATTLKQVIAATWNIMRRETDATPSAAFVPDVTSVETSQARIKDQTTNLGDQLTDDRSQAFLASSLKNMDDAITQLKAAESTPAVKSLPDALTSEQAAYQDLLKLRAREFQVTRGNQQQNGQQNAAQQRRQQQVDQMNPQNQRNPYQAQRNAQQQQQPDMNQQAQQETDEQRETRQVLSRLRDLAQRQDDLNRQMQELQTQLQQAQTPEQRDEVQRQLANLRDQQQQQLRDADELANRMDQPQNQEPMAQARQQLDQTRNNLQQAAQNLNNGQMQQAAAAGQRAGEQLNNLQNQMRQAAAGQFGQQMTQMRQQAQQLEQNQQQIDQQLANLNQPAQTAPTGLRDLSAQDSAQQRTQVTQNLTQQKQQLQNLLDNMQQTIQQADGPEPLLSRQLYDTYRNAQQQQPDKAMDTSRQLVQQGLLQEARQTDSDASQAVTRLREGVDQAASGVLGDETAALRRARQQLDDLAQQLDREAGAAAATQAGAAGTQPGRGGDRQLANATQPGARGAGGTQPGAAAGKQPGGRGAETQPGERQLAQNDQAGQPGARGAQARGGQPGQPGQPGAGGNPNGQPGAAGTQPDGQPGDRQLAQNDQPGQPGARGAQARGGQPGQPGARGNANGQPGAGTQPDGQPGDQRLAQNDQAGQPGQLGARGGQNPGGNRAGRNGQPGAAGTQPGQPDEQGNTPDQQLARGGQNRGGTGLRPNGQPGANAQTQPGGPGQPGDVTQPGDQNPQLAQGGPGGAGLRVQQRGGGDFVAGTEPATRPEGGPITGNGFRNFTDNLRDIEETVSDPRLRDQAANIRQAATNLRQGYLNAGKPPSWNIVQDTLSRPLTDLRNAVNQEIQRRESAQAAIPLDRDAVPPAYQDQVRIYYEHLGSGK